MIYLYLLAIAVALCAFERWHVLEERRIFWVWAKKTSLTFDGFDVFNSFWRGGTVSVAEAIAEYNKAGYNKIAKYNKKVLKND